jgi:predicted dehydrogenase
MKLKLGIIGAGNISKFHIEAFTSLGAEIAVIAATTNSLNAKMVSSKYRIPTVLQNWQDITSAEYELDGFIVCTPPGVTPDILKHLALFDKPILVEKPISYDPQFLKEIKIVSAAPIYVAYNRKFYESVREIRNQVSNREVFFNATIVEDSFKNSMETLEEIVCGNSVHILNLCLHIFGELNVVDLQIMSNNIGITAKFNNTSKDYVGNLQILFGIPKNSSIEILAYNFRGNLSPIESFERFDSFKIIEPNEYDTVRRYIPTWSENSPSVVASSAEFKPGFLGQAEAFMKICLGEESNSLSSLDEAIRTLEIATEIFDYAVNFMKFEKSYDANA